HYESEKAAEPPDDLSIETGRQKNHCEDRQDKRRRRIGEQNLQSELIDPRPFVNRTISKRHHHSGESRQRHSDLSTRRQSFTRLHLDKVRLHPFPDKFGINIKTV